MTTAPTINEMRTHLMETLASLRNRENPMEPDRARAVAQVAAVMVDSAKVEVDYLKTTQQQNSAFFEEASDGVAELPKVPQVDSVGQALQRISGAVVTRTHRLK